jgi:hypothetical protein
LADQRHAKPITRQIGSVEKLQTRDNFDGARPGAAFIKVPHTCYSMRYTGVIQRQLWITLLPRQFFLDISPFVDPFHALAS